MLIHSHIVLRSLLAVCVVLLGTNYNQSLGQVLSTGTAADHVLAISEDGSDLYPSIGQS